MPSGLDSVMTISAVRKSRNLCEGFAKSGIKNINQLLLSSPMDLLRLPGVGRGKYEKLMDEIVRLGFGTDAPVLRFSHHYNGGVYYGA